MPGRNAFYAQAGGVTAVLNATAASVIEACRESGRIERVFAGVDGILGAFREELIDTSLESPGTLEALRHTPGGAFGSARFRLGEFDDERERYERLAAVFAAHDIGYVFYNGGNGSADTTLKLSRLPHLLGYPLTCVHVPKTVDNDLPETDCSPGFGSAAKYLAVSLREAAADVASMCATSTRVFILESMGRHAGWMVAAMGLAVDDDGAPPHLLLFAEVPFDEAVVMDRVREAVSRHGHCVIGVSEGLRHPTGEFVAQVGTAEPGRNAQLGGVAPWLAARILDRLGFKCHWATADYLQRSARHLASATDLAHAEAVGRAAVKLALEGSSGVMPTIIRGSDDPYSWRVGQADLHAIATLEKRLPQAFISRDRLHITDLARTYLSPLIRGEAPVPYRDGLPVHARLVRRRAAQRLPSLGNLVESVAPPKKT